MKLTHVRNATMVVELGGLRLLVDPCLAPAAAWAADERLYDARRNPVAELPEVERLTEVDAVLVSHTHVDHWDDVAAAELPSGVPLLCQPPDESVLVEQGFTDVRPVESRLALGRVTVARTGGQHGLGPIATLAGPVSGFVLAAEAEPVLYLAGDTVWCPDVELALTAHTPDVIVVNAGAARLFEGSRLTMDADDVRAVLQTAGQSTVVAVHMEAISHCTLRRAELGAALRPLADRLRIPADGERLSFEVAA